MQAYRFWVKVFALSFALGVVSGITMSFQFGINWPGFMQSVGNIAGPLLACEVFTAFFLEATFLGIMLYGHSRVGDRLHTLGTALVAGGTTLSAFWILVLNSWMHTPTGFEMRDGVAHATDWWAIVFNPSLPYRLSHMLIASGLTVAFLIAGVSAYRWRHGDRGDDVALTDARRRHRGGAADPAADRGRRPARPEHAGTSAGQDRCHRSRLADTKRRAFGAVRPARRSGARDAPPDQSSEARVAGAHA